MKLDLLGNNVPMPLVIEPEGPHDPVHDPATLTRWAGDNKDWIEEKLLEHGALLFRGYGFHSPEAFETFSTSISPKFLDYVRGASPRTKVKGKVYTSTDSPWYMPIPLHCDMSSYGRTAPAKIFFNCLVPAVKGGQTPIADMHKMYLDLDPGVRRRFEEKGLRMIQNVPERKTLFNPAPKTWPVMFETDDRSEVEYYCRHQQIEYRWRADGGIQLINDCAAVVEHPRSGLKVWFNSAHNFYPSWSWELHRVHRPLAAWLLKRNERRQMKLDPLDRRNNVTFGDGSEVSAADIEHIRAKYWEHAILFDWQAGDVLLIDNIRVAHGRMPFRKGPRKVLAVMSEPWEKPAGHRPEPSEVLADGR